MNRSNVVEIIIGMAIGAMLGYQIGHIKEPWRLDSASFDRGVVCGEIVYMDHTNFDIEDIILRAWQVATNHAEGGL